MKCPKCGYCPPLGRPRGLNDEVVKFFYKKGFSMQELADKMGVSKSAIQGSLRRTKK